MEKKEELLKSQYYYELPEELIAQTPAEKRDNSRLMVLDRKTGKISHKHFYDIVDYLNAGDALVLNDSKVIPARLHGKRYAKSADGKIESEPSGSDIEVLLLKRIDEKTWETIVRPGKKMHKGTKIKFSDKLSGEVKEVCEDGNRIVEFTFDGEFFSILDEVGQTPLPPYITNKNSPKDRYQTVYAKYEGSSAAPTAGLHFTKELLEKIEKKGVKLIYVTLHVGLGTFRPVKEDVITDHKMHSEYYTVSQESAEAFNQTKKNGGRIFCVGTTSCRTIESACDENGILTAKSANTDIFIYPGYKFKALDCLITNFHLPESTLIMLVSALAGREKILEAYREAVKEKYRFFSFGDAMLII
jgi:S-adenosylmethionine:tRNA ribosyltransferase-isomerase